MSPSIVILSTSPKAANVQRVSRIAADLLGERSRVIVKDLSPYLAADALASAGDLRFVVLDVTDVTPEAAVFIGARLLQRDLTTICVTSGAASDGLRSMLGRALVELPARDDGPLRACLAEALVAAPATANDALPAPPALAFTRAVSGPPILWNISPDKKHRVGIWRGNITDVRGVDAWVNPENTFMEMARSYDVSISAIIRYLGAEWYRNNSDSDDFVFRSLLDAVSRKDGVERPVPPGSVYITGSGRLRKKHKVKVIAHVACVEPRDVSTPGSGYKPVGDIGACVTSVLSELSKPQHRDIASVLVPLFGTGTAGGDLHATTEILARSAVDFLRTARPSRLKTVYFLAYTNKDLDSSVSALENLEGLERA